MVLLKTFVFLFLLAIGSSDKNSVEPCFGESVSADNWAFNSNGAYGIIGAGPNSALWNGFVDASSLTATYSIELSRIQAFSHRLSQSV